MINKITKVILGAVLAVFGAVGLMSFSASAAETPSGYIQISPVLERISIAPGEVYTGTFHVNNIGSDTFKYKLKASRYSVTGDDYTPNYSNKTAYNKLAEWVEFDREGGELAPGGSDEIAYTITVPTDVPAGGQYAALIAEIDNSKNKTETDKGQTSIQTVAQVALLVYAKISGNTREEGTIKSNDISGFLTEGPITATSVVENTGNVDVEAKYIFKVFPFFSGEEVYTNEDNPTVRTILPETTRFNTESWNEAPGFGIFNVEQTVDFLGKSENKTVKRLVIICPFWLIIVIALFILTVVFWIVSRVVSRKKKAGATK